MPRASAQKPKPPRKPSVVIEDQQKLFADMLAEGKSKAEAARIAGYHPSNVDNVMRQEEVQVYLEEARGQIEDVSTLRRVDVLNIFMEAIDMARTLADPSQMINGADKVAKMMGYYAPETLKLEVEQNSKSLSNKFRQLSDAELYEIAAGRAKVIDGEVLADA
jgi:phage terminase small subunit